VLPDVVCLAGPTASGKTRVALQLAAVLAHERAVEIISVDSALVYRGLDIGTAKPSADERAAVPHHLIDILDPTEAYSAARFVADAYALIAQINARGRTALLVGGTMLYFKALFDGLDALPGADAAVRAAIDAQAAREGWPALHAELARVDPVTAARLAPGDAQRVQRALEVVRISGTPLSQLHGVRRGAAFTPLLIALEPDNRAWLHERIETRFQQMIHLGLLDEVRALRARADLHAALPAMRCVGYRQAWSALESGDFMHWQAQALAATRQLAKRQLTWLRGMPQRCRVACDGADVDAQVLQLVRGAAVDPSVSRRPAAPR
jgi:tRNA dimethylallyltransferase